MEKNDKHGREKADIIIFRGVDKIMETEELKVTGPVTLEELLHPNTTKSRHNAENEKLFQVDLTDILNEMSIEIKAELESITKE